MKEKNKKNIHIVDNDKIFNTNTVVSSTETTGLMPTPPLSSNEAESYTEIYDVPRPEVKANKDLHHK